MNESKALTLLTVGADPQQLDRIRRQMPNCHWLAIWPNADKTKPPEVDGVIVFARPRQEKQAYSVCCELRQEEGMKDTPLLVAINRYQMMLGNDVKRLPMSHFIITPFDRTELETKLDLAQKAGDDRPHPDFQ